MLYTNYATAAYPVTDSTLDPYLTGRTPQSMGNGLIDTLVSIIEWFFYLRSSYEIDNHYR